MEIFSVLLAFCVGNSSVTGEFLTQRPVTRCFDVFFDLRRNKRLSKQSWGEWFETPSCSLWHHCNDTQFLEILDAMMLMWHHGIENKRSYQNIPYVCSDMTVCWGWSPRYHLANIRIPIIQIRRSHVPLIFRTQLYIYLERLSCWNGPGDM